MGCCATGRTQCKLKPLSPEETAIIFQEDLLGYHNVHLSKALETLERYTSNGKLTINQFKSFATDLSLNSEDLDTLESPLFVFYQRFWTGKAGYDSYKLSLLVILLCKGSIQEKAEELFKRCPTFKEGFVTDTGIQQLLNSLFDLSIDFLPNLALSDSPTPGQSLSAEVLTAYKTRLIDGRGLTWRRLYVKIVLTKKRLTLPDFATALIQSQDWEREVSARQMRKMLVLELEEKQRQV